MTHDSQYTTAFCGAATVLLQPAQSTKTGGSKGRGVLTVVEGLVADSAAVADDQAVSLCSRLMPPSQ